MTVGCTAAISWPPLANNNALLSSLKFIFIQTSNAQWFNDMPLHCAVTTNARRGFHTQPKPIIWLFRLVLSLFTLSNLWQSKNYPAVATSACLSVHTGLSISVWIIPTAVPPYFLWSAGVSSVYLSLHVWSFPAWISHPWSLWSKVS